MMMTQGICLRVSLDCGQKSPHTDSSNEQKILSPDSIMLKHIRMSHSCWLPISDKFVSICSELHSISNETYMPCFLNT